MELSKYEKYALIKIRKWETKRRGFLVDTAAKPVDYLIQKIGKEKFKHIENVVETTLDKMLHTATYSVNEKELLKRAHDNGIIINDLSELKTCPLKLLDNCNEKHIRMHERVSAAQGAAAGLGGALTATADLTAILIQIFHLLQEIAFCYGFDPNDPVEKLILLRIIEGGIGSTESKFKALREISILEKIQLNGDIDPISGKPVKAFSTKAMSEYIEKLTLAIISRFMRRALPIPLLTIAAGAHSNHEMMENSGETAFMVYRKKFIIRKRDLL
ncbi:hypothetical protein. Homolog to OMM_9 MMP and HMP6 = 130011 BW-1 [Desulfamplus magnetovallimortis]|uniref:EcsC family protein n=1 Tax=Desulfamplus magnetovallimortis TaxID=1246637 RepID=L0R5F3_9BACT|nr:EcsC family protein [Desulfamplus magnetovallimortis]CCO06747.1 hypothetical protein. Homolog to OMM_9 MMP and HMP6 = 130011 BW-1 [Desulfamplus magnetovallimortis BW-1]SLM32798.1 hypothetical protein. Homolog to OMM_9 MMP and HMP6 = 130011 BW-1 [Desulfamplus magnetovallimortis]